MTTTYGAAPSRSFRVAGSPRLVAAAGICSSLLALWFIVVVHANFARSNDFQYEAWPWYQVLYAGHPLDFLQHGPGYIGSLVLRLPFAMVGMAAHGGWKWTFVLSAVPCVISAPILGSWLTRESPTIWRWLSPLGVLLVLNPLVWFDILMGHPETLVAGVLLVGGTVLAAQGRVAFGMFLAGVAVVNQPWALAGAPVVFAAVPRHRIRALTTFLITAAVFYVPVEITHALAQNPSQLGLGSAGIFYPGQLWWWLGPNDVIANHAHPLIVATGFGLSGAWWLRRGRHFQAGPALQTEALLLMALVLLLRAAMDPWNNVYYELPFLIAVFALEAGRPPRYSIAAMLLMFIVTVPLGTSDVNWDMRALAYQLATVPIILGLGVRVLAPEHAWHRVRAMAAFSLSA